jgi:hypothetical protein
MQPGDREHFLKEFYSALEERPLDPDDPRYVHLYESDTSHQSDPVDGLATVIEWNSLESKQLFSGFRGTGKSTELRRLRARLRQQASTKVVLCDMETYLNPSTPVDVSDFLVTVAGAFSDELERDPDLLGKDMAHEGYWTRFRAFMTRTRIDLPAADGSGKDDQGAAGIKLSLKADPTFRQTLQQHMKGHIGALSQDVNQFMEDCVKALRARHGDDTRVVLILDSVERIRGTSINADEVAASLQMLFEGHADKLGFPYIHVIYTVPPWLKIKSSGLAGLYDGSQQIPCIKVRDAEGQKHQDGLDLLQQIVAGRGHWPTLLGERERLDALSLASGGYLRDLFRLLREVLILARTRDVPASADVIELAMHKVRNAYWPIANSDVLWLQRIQESRSTELPDNDKLHDLSRFFDTHLVLTYRNGHEWWAVHPLIAGLVADKANALRSAPA